MPPLKDFARNAEGAGYAFAAGYVDVIGFIALAGLFTAHVTGNIIMIGVEAVGTQNGLLLKILALPIFVGVVAFTRISERARLRCGRDPVVPLVGLESLLLIAFAIAGTTMHAASPDSRAYLATLTGLLAVAAMAVQNALSRTSLSDLGPTTIMTGNSTQIVVDIVDLLSPSTPEEHAAISKRLAKMIPSVLAFATGAILGGLLFSCAGYWAVALPVSVLFALCAHRALAPNATALAP
ncbi:YoaK family protein [Cupriavidus pauculus]|uniref:YoaK family protein n=1 Tax=Cupriavidus pauculus TaxID=82633 RepID=UPI001EE2945C|nr:YoaK family protein [Cupriavidus pauculus]GJG95077.1 DUF1275 domain-containing protein [Cupriavidus pauculus]